MIEINSLGKSFGHRPVLRGVDLSVAKGEFVTLFGPNGAGKTTLLRIVATLMRPTVGRVQVGGFDLASHAHIIRSALGVVSHQTLLYNDLTAEENLRFYARMYAVPESGPRIDAVLEQVGLARRRRELVRTFSRGMQQRLAIARAVLHKPAVMLFDEPHSGLDQDAAAMLDDVLKAVAAGGRTVLMTTHDLTRGLALADRVAVLRRGKIAFNQSTVEIDAAHFTEMYAGVVNG